MPCPTDSRAWDFRGLLRSDIGKGGSNASVSVYCRTGFSEARWVASHLSGREKGQECTRRCVLASWRMGIDSTSPDDFQRALARELHDHVAQTLSPMLSQLEKFKMGQSGNQIGLREIAELQESTRDVLVHLRQVLYGLRGLPAVEEDFTDAVRLLMARLQASLGQGPIVPAIAPRAGSDS
jgi:hypothetical protein